MWSTVRWVDAYTLVGSKIVSGWNPDRHVFFAARFEEPVGDFMIFREGKPVIYNTSRFRSSRETWGTGLKVCLRFPTTEGQQLSVKVAVSATGIDGALRNLRELDGKDFDTVRAEADALWNCLLYTSRCV